MSIIIRLLYSGNELLCNFLQSLIPKIVNVLKMNFIPQCAKTDSLCLRKIVYIAIKLILSEVQKDHLQRSAGSQRIEF